jgi:hypothetical protein
MLDPFFASGAAIVGVSVPLSLVTFFAQKRLSQAQTCFAMKEEE